MNAPPVLERKAKFIGQLLRGKLDVREIEYVGATALSYGEIKALAAGDPLLLEKAQVDADLMRFRRLERAHGRSQDRLRWQIVSFADRKSTLERTAVQLDDVLPIRQDTSGDAFRMRTGAGVFDKRVDAARAVQGVLAGLTRELGYQREATVPVGQLGGLAVEATAIRRTTGIELTLRCTNVPFTSVDIKVEALHDDSKAIGLISRLENRISALDARRREVIGDIEAVTVESDRAQARIGVPFAQAGDLSAAMLRATDIEGRLTEAMLPPSLQDSAAGADELSSDRTDPYWDFGGLESGPDDVDLDWGPNERSALQRPLFTDHRWPGRGGRSDPTLRSTARRDLVEER